MKNFLLLFAVIIFLIFTGCAKKDRQPEKTIASELTLQMFCKVDGKDWKCDEKSSYVEKSEKSIHIHCQKMYQNSSGATDFDYFDFQLQKELKPGDYTFKISGPNTCTFVPGGPQILKYNANSGKLMISKSDTENLEGTFEFMAKTEDGKIATITEGKFNGKFRTQ
jgi:hypothetical protein